MIRTRLVTQLKQESTKEMLARQKLGLPLESFSYTVEWEEPDVPPHGVRDTSRIAYEKFKASQQMNKQHNLIVEFMKANSGNWTRNELFVKTKLPINVITPRVRELLDMGILRELPKRICRSTKNPAHGLELK